MCDDKSLQVQMEALTESITQLPGSCHELCVLFSFTALLHKDELSAHRASSEYGEHTSASL